LLEVQLLTLMWRVILFMLRQGRVKRLEQYIERGTIFCRVAWVAHYAAP
jgi:hypothetical protein